MDRLDRPLRFCWLWANFRNYEARFGQQIVVNAVSPCGAISIVDDKSAADSLLVIERRLYGSEVARLNCR
jgi:hypothetical protein